jgi:hypothetical protein
MKNGHVQLFLIFLFIPPVFFSDGPASGFCHSLLPLPVRANMGPGRNFRQDTNPGARSLCAAKGKGDWNPSSVEPGGSTPYLHPLEKQIVIELNQVRSNPAGYARTHLAELKKYFVGDRLELPGRVPLVTREGVAAVDECLNFLIKQKPRTVLAPKRGLTRAARDHARDQGKTGDHGHIGSDRSTLDIRLSRYGQWGGKCAENISYGSDEARMIVLSLLVDDGVKSRGHRKNILEGSFRFTGVACGPHPKLRHVCVIVFAAAYTDR